MGITVADLTSIRDEWRWRLAMAHERIREAEKRAAEALSYINKANRLIKEREENDQEANSTTA